MPGWLVTSIILSVVLTVLLNLVPRLFPDATRRAGERLHEAVNRPPEPGDPSPRVRIFFPWKAMLIGSLALTVLVNVVAALSN